VNDAFNNLRYEIEVRNRTIAGKVLGWKVVFLKKRFDKSMLESGGE
jgi:hypothetical protein